MPIIKKLLFCLLLISAALPLSCCDRSPGYKSAGGRFFQKQADNKWLYTHDPSTEQRLWIAVFDTEQTANKEFAGKMTVTTDKPVQVVARLARARIQEPYEGSFQRVSLEPGVPAEIEVSHTFQSNHAELKLQLDVVECKDPAVEFTIEDISVSVREK